MDVKEVIKNRHSVRQYKDTPIGEEIRSRLDELAKKANEESGLNIQVIYDDPDCFNSLLAHYGKFKNVNNYIAIVGDKKLENMEELGGYYGQMLVLHAQDMGLNTCWVGGTYGKGKCKADKAKGEASISERSTDAGYRAAPSAFAADFEKRSVSTFASME